LAERAEAFGDLVEVEVVAAVDVDVFCHGRPEVGNVVVVDLEAVGAELFDGRSEEAGVEGGDAVDDECEAQGLGRLVGELAVADVAVVGEVHRLT
jgi:hypothetical protein